jgi:hypothetical protein
MFSHFTEEMITAMKTQNILYHYHHRSVPVINYIEYPTLLQEFKILSVNNIDGQYIATSVEARRYPIYMTQYHPEVVLDAADDIHSVRSPINFQIAQGFAGFFGREC